MKKSEKAIYVLEYLKAQNKDVSSSALNAELKTKFNLKNDREGIKIIRDILLKKTDVIEATRSGKMRFFKLKEGADIEAVRSSLVKVKAEKAPKVKKEKAVVSETPAAVATSTQKLEVVGTAFPEVQTKPIPSF